jgi:hypothetical protein
MPGLVPGIHVFMGPNMKKTRMATKCELARISLSLIAEAGKARLLVTSPAMTGYTV